MTFIIFASIALGFALGIYYCVRGGVPSNGHHLSRSINRWEEIEKGNRGRQ